MTHAGDVVLFGGAIEPGETAARAALRELCEESGTLDHLDDPEYRVRDELGEWTTESGTEVHGFLIDLPANFTEIAQPDPREVAAIGFLQLSTLIERPPTPAYHRVDARDTQSMSKAIHYFESPTIDLVNAVTGDAWTLWGAAGQMAAFARPHLL